MLKQWQGIMLKIPTCGLPNPAVSFKRAYRKQGEFAPLLSTKDRIDRYQRSIDKSQNSVWYANSLEDIFFLLLDLSYCWGVVHSSVL